MKYIYDEEKKKIIKQVLTADGEKKELIDPAEYVEVQKDGTVLVVPAEREVDVSCLNIGTYYSYKKLMELLGLKYTTNKNTKTNQLDMIGRYAELEKKGAKYLVKSIYSSPLPVCTTFRSQAKYVSDMTDVLLAYFFNHFSQNIYFNFNELYEICGLVNKEYLWYNSRRDELARKQNIRITDVDDFYFRVVPFVRSIVESALKALRVRSILEFYTVFYISIKQGEDQPFFQREADDDEVAEILNIQKEVLKYFHFEDLRVAHATAENRLNFYSKFNSLIRKRYPGWASVYKTIKVIAPLRGVIDEIRETRARQVLNKKVFDYVITHVDKTYKQYKGQFQYDEAWQAAQYLLSDILITL